MSNNEFDLEIATVYNDVMSAIKNFKDQQWKLAYYCLILLGAVYAVRDNTQISQIFLILVALTITVIGLWMLLDLQYTLVENRIMAIDIREDFLENTKDYFPDSPNYTRFWGKFYDFNLIFAVVIILALTLIFLALHVPIPYAVPLIFLHLYIIIGWRLSVKLKKGTKKKREKREKKKQQPPPA